MFTWVQFDIILRKHISVGLNASTFLRAIIWSSYLIDTRVSLCPSRQVTKSQTTIKYIEKFSRISNRAQSNSFGWQNIIRSIFEFALGALLSAIILLVWVIFWRKKIISRVFIFSVWDLDSRSINTILGLIRRIDWRHSSYDYWSSKFQLISIEWVEKLYNFLIADHIYNFSLFAKVNSIVLSLVSKKKQQKIKQFYSYTMRLHVLYIKYIFAISSLKQFKELQRLNYLIWFIKRNNWKTQFENLKKSCWKTFEFKKLF
jgi:hypothetical protein